MILELPGTSFRSVFLFYNIGRLLFEERLRKNKTIRMVSQYTGISERHIDEAEIARRSMRWHVIARLLKYYGKRFEVRLVKEH